MGKCVQNKIISGTKSYTGTHTRKRLFVAKICRQLRVQPSSQNLQTRQYKTMEVLMCTCLWHVDVKRITSVLSNKQLFMIPSG